MTETRKYSTPEKIFVVLIFAGCLLFFGFFYRYHLFFTEQLQIFRLTTDQFMSYLSRPAFLSSFIGDFLTQFYYLQGGGAVVITAALFALWLVTRQLVNRIYPGNDSLLFPLLPVVVSWIALCDPEFPVSNVISLIISVTCTLIYLSQSSFRIRLLLVIILTPVLYIAAGSSFYILTATGICYEIIQKEHRQGFFNGILFIAAALFFPLMAKSIYLLTAPQALTYLSEMTSTPSFFQYLPMLTLICLILSSLLLSQHFFKTRTVFGLTGWIISLVVILVMGIRLTADFTMEKILRLDFEASHNQWNKVYELSGRYRMRNSLSAYFTNMALSKLDILPDSLMRHYQPAATGLFIPVNANENYMTIAFSNEVYWQLGDVNASQHSALLGMVFSPRAKNSRLMKRLIEINIVNGEYAVAEKYIGILEKTLFYRNWATEKRKYLFNEEECKRSGWIMEKRALIPTNDLLKKSNEYIITLRMLADNHSGNRMAVDYLLCFHLLSKDISSFITDFERYYTSEMGASLPEVYQEGLLISIGSGRRNPGDYSKFRFNNEIIRNFADYTREYEENNGKGAALYKKYGKTYWFYYHFAKMNNE
jgi:hypothetical protein